MSEQRGDNELGVSISEPNGSTHGICHDPVEKSSALSAECARWPTRLVSRQATSALQRRRAQRGWWIKNRRRSRAPSKLLPCRVFRLGGQRAPWLVGAADLAELIDRQREKSS